MTKIILSKEKIGEGVVVLPVKKWQKIEKERKELVAAFEAIIAGEVELKSGKVRPSEELLKELCQK